MRKPRLTALLLLGACQSVPDATRVATTAGPACAVPADLQPAPAQPPEAQRLLPVTSLVLAYYWWPQNCLRPDSASTPGCRQHFGFKVHGLWPDGAGSSYPQFCRPPTPIAAATVRANYCLTPSPALMQHEWAKHGTCHWPSAERYFDAARAVAGRIATPDAAGLPARGLTAGRIRDAFAAANPEIPRGALFVGVDRKKWLTEVRVCLDLDYRPAPCEAGIGTPDPVAVRVRPR